MRYFTFSLTVLLCLAPQQLLQAQAQPLYQVTIVSRTTKAINYGYLSAPTRIDFRGTPVLAASRGEAIVEPRKGSTMLDLKFQGLEPPSRFGAQYLTYVVWAISPEGRAQNLGELTFDGGGKAKLKTSTPMQTFAMIVTTEPYYSVNQPSDVVVMENAVGPGTIGKVQEVNATYELLPRKPYQVEANAPAPKGAVQPANQEQYEAMVALYQALNAIQIAQSLGADKYAPDQLARARQIYNQARGYPAHLSKEIVSLAREATQIAEDSRAISVRRSDAEKTAIKSVETTTVVSSAPVTPPPAPEPAPVPVVRVTPQPAAPVVQEAQRARTDEAIAVDHQQFLKDKPQALENRKRIMAALPTTFEVNDSARGIVVVLPEHLVSAPSLRSYLTPIAAAVSPYRDLHIEVGGHGGSVAATERDAAIVKSALTADGLSADLIAARGYGNTRPRSATAAQNRRVEIVIAGDSIGILPTWDRTYSVRP